MDPQQELFSALLLELKKQYPDSVYDTFLPPEGTPYPFIYLADSDLNDRANKTAVFGTVSQTIHVWHDNPRQRGTAEDAGTSESTMAVLTCLDAMAIGAASAWKCVCRADITMRRLFRTPWSL